VRRFYVHVVSLAVFSAGMWPVVTSGAESVQIVDARAPEPVTLQSVTMEGGVISGQVMNHANYPIRDVNILIQHAFAWRNEFRPGKDDPSRAEYYTVTGEIPAGGSKQFSMRLPEPLPTREDGSFVTRAQVAGYKEIGVVKPTASHAEPGALSPLRRS
jgi:hypothetical protein